MNVKQFLKSRFIDGRTAGFYTALAAALLFIVSDIIYIAADFGDRTFSFITFALILIGALVEIAYAFCDMKVLDFMPIIACACYCAAFGMHIYLGLPTLSDIWNGVNFVGGNAEAVIIFALLFGMGLIAAIVANFMVRRKEVSGN